MKKHRSVIRKRQAEQYKALAEVEQIVSAAKARVAIVAKHILAERDEK